jgi:hypothetical protein
MPASTNVREAAVAWLEKRKPAKRTTKNNLQGRPNDS